MSATEAIPEEKSAAASLFPFQLTDVRLYEVAAKRREEQAEPTTELPFSVNLHRADDPPAADEFGLILSFQATVPAGQNRKCDITISTEGRFKSLVDVNTLKQEVIERFKSSDATILLWPYLRQHLHDLTTKMRLDLPPIPTLDVRAILEVAEQPPPSTEAMPT